MNVETAARIPVRNLYHMLVYAWDQLEVSSLVDVDSSGHHDVCNLLARVLCDGLRLQLRRGLDRGYVAQEEVTARPRGRLDLATSVKQHTFWSNRAACRYDEFEADILPNRIMRSTLAALQRTEGLEQENIHRVRGLLHELRDITPIRLTSHDFHRVPLHGNNRFYRFLLNVCECLHHLLLPETSVGKRRLRDFIQDDKRMPRLFQRFVLNFYKRHLPAAKVGAPHIDWALCEADAEAMSSLPRMESDVVLEWPERKVILDCKFYRQALVERHGAFKLHSAHLYQLFTYIKNQAAQPGWELTEGILVYPAMNADFDWCYRFGPHRVRVATVDLRKHWREIEARLLDVANAAQNVMAV